MRAFDVDLGSAARLMRLGGRSGAFVLAGVAVAGWMWVTRVRPGVSGEHLASAVRTGLGTGVDVGPIVEAQPEGARDKYSAVVEAWYALHWTERGQGRDPFGEPASPSGGRSAGPDVEPEVHAVWLQEGERLAVIDGQLVREGGMHQGYRVERCEAGAVWLMAGGRCRRWAVRFPAVSSDHAGSSGPGSGM